MEPCLHSLEQSVTAATAAVSRRAVPVGLTRGAAAAQQGSAQQALEERGFPHMR